MNSNANELKMLDVFRKNGRARVWLSGRVPSSHGRLWVLASVLEEERNGSKQTYLILVN